MPRALRRLAVVVIGLAALDAAAQRSDDAADATARAGQHFAAGQEAFARGDYGQALIEFRAAVEAGDDGPAAHYNIAVCQYRLGDYSAAERSFRELASRYPQMRSLADYNLGLALVRSNEVGRARDAFLRAARSADDRVAALARTMLARLPSGSAAASEDSWIRLIDFGLGHDDNVALIDPLGLPAGRSSESGFGELLLYAEGPAAPAMRWRIAASAFLLEHADAGEYDQGAFELRAGYAKPVGDWVLSVGPRIGRTWLGGDGFTQDVGAGLELERANLTDSVGIEIELGYDEVDDVETQFAYAAGSRSRLAVRLRKDLPGARFRFEYRLARDDRAGAGVDADRALFAFGFGRPFGPDWSGDLGIERRDSEYGRLIPPRDEVRLRLAVRAVRRLASGWQLTSQYQYSDNDSSDPAYGYRRHRLSLGASRSF